MWPHTCERDDLYPICSIGSLVALYGSTMHVALSPGTIHSFVVLHNEKLAFQCATLLSWEQGLGIFFSAQCVSP